MCDPTEDYRQAREIISSYLWAAEAKDFYKEASDILDDLKEKGDRPFLDIPEAEHKSGAPTVNVGGVTYPKIVSNDPGAPSIGTVFDEAVPHKFVFETSEGTYLVRTRDNVVVGIEEL